MGTQTDVRKMIHDNIVNNRNRVDKLVPRILFLAALVSVVTTLGIVATLIFDSVKFFQMVPFSQVFSTELAPLRAENPTFGILPLINGTVFSSLIAMAVAGPVGLTAAI